MANQEKFFRALGTKVRELRKKRGYSQEDMISFGFSARHWQQVEGGTANHRDHAAENLRGLRSVYRELGSRSR